MAAAVMQNTNDSHVTHEQKAEQAAAQKLPSDKIMIMLPVLQEYLNIADEHIAEINGNVMIGAAKVSTISSQSHDNAFFSGRRFQEHLFLDCGNTIFLTLN